MQLHIVLREQMSHPPTHREQHIKSYKSQNRHCLSSQSSNTVVTWRQHAKCDFSVVYTVQGYCASNVPCPHSKWCGLCVTEKQATDAACCGPGAGVKATRLDGFMCSIYLPERSALVCFKLTQRSIVAIWPCTRIKRQRVCRNYINTSMALHMYNEEMT